MAKAAEGPIMDDRMRKLIDEGLATLHRAIPEIDKFERAGEDVSDYRDRARHMRERFLALRREFWPAATPPQQD